MQWLYTLKPNLHGCCKIETCHIDFQKFYWCSSSLPASFSVSFGSTMQACLCICTTAQSSSTLLFFSVITCTTPHDKTKKMIQAKIQWIRIVNEFSDRVMTWQGCMNTSKNQRETAKILSFLAKTGLPFTAAAPTEVNKRNSCLQTMAGRYRISETPIRALSFEELLPSHKVPERSGAGQKKG